MDLWNGCDVNWANAGKSAVKGLIAGGVTGLTLGAGGAAIAGSVGGGVQGGMLAGGTTAMAGNAVGQGAAIGLGWQSEFSGTEMAVVGGIGGVGGGLLLRPSTAPMQPVVSWAPPGVTPDLNPGRWVMTGSNSIRNWVGTGCYKYPISNSTPAASLPASNLAYPPGAEAVKGLIGQRVIVK